MVSDRPDGQPHQGSFGGRLTIHAVVRSRLSDRALDTLGRRAVTPGFEVLADREIAAIVTRTSATDSADSLQVHDRVVSSLLRRSSVVPMPHGLMAPDDVTVIAFLREERIPLLEALDHLEDCYEVRLHVSEVDLEWSATARHEAGATIFAEARSRSRGARLLDARTNNVLDAAFLIRRGEWIQFVESLSDWERRISGLRVDVTGPWPAWDFVELTLGAPNDVEIEG
jgi:hypothetical protein